MDKYHIKEDILTPAESFLQCIANELAEANRLKRMEMELKYSREVLEDFK